MSQVDHDDEIDLAELFASLWAYKLLISIVTAAAITVSIVYALWAPEEYTSSAIFMRKETQSGPRIPSQYSDLAALAGLGGAGSANSTLFDRITGRDFVVRLSNRLDLVGDPYFYEQEVKEASAFGIEKLKVLVLEQMARFAGQDIAANSTLEPNIDPLDDVFKIFQESVQVSETKNGSTEIVVTHEDAGQAARIANGVVALLIEEVEAEERAEQRQQLNYLSGELATALAEAEQTKRSVAEFALQNSLTSEGAFAQRSEAMFRLRDELDKILNMQDAVDALLEVLSDTRAPSREAFELLRVAHPTVDDVDFRRLLSVPEALNAWAWPTLARLQDFSVTLRDREVRTVRSLDELNREAVEYASATERLASLKREAQVAEATYNVLIEQVKAQSLAFGYEGKAFQIYQSAVPSPVPSAPKKSRIVALGGVLGLFLGSALALLSAMRSGVLRTRRAITEAAAPRLTCAAPRLGAFSTNFARAVRRLANLQSSDLIELLIAVREGRRGDHDVDLERIILVAATGRRIRSLPVGLYLATHLAGLTGQEAGEEAEATRSPMDAVSLFVLGERPPKLDGGAPIGSGLIMRASSGGVEVIAPRSQRDLSVIISGGLLGEEVRRARGDGRRVVVAASETYAAAVSRALRDGDPFIVTVSRPGASLKALISRLRQIAGIDVNVFVGRV